MEHKNQNKLYLACFHNTSKKQAFARAIQACEKINGEQITISHVGIVFYNHIVCEWKLFDATLKKGVSLSSLEKRIDEYNGDIFYIELCDVEPYFAEISDFYLQNVGAKYYKLPLIAMELKNHNPFIQIPYSIVNAIFDIIKPIYDSFVKLKHLITKKDNAEFFCSELVVNLLNHLNLFLQYNMQHEQETTPQDLYKIFVKNGHKIIKS
jgi:hypothetical protein